MKKLPIQALVALAIVAVGAVFTVGELAYARISNPPSSVSTPVSIANGGTNATSFTTTNGIVQYSGTALVTSGAGYTITTTGGGLATLTNASTTNLTVGTYFELPKAASITTTIAGQCAIDTTTNQLRCGASNLVYSNGYVYRSFTYATSTAWTGTTTVPLGPALLGETWDQLACFTDAGTVGVSIYDGTNRMDYMPTASTTVNINTLSTNNSFTALEKRYVDIGTPASSPTKLSCTVRSTITAD